MPQFATESAHFEPGTARILWPERYLPARAEIFAEQQATIAAPPETVWAWLLAAETWPAWQPAVRNIHFLSHAGPVLRDRSRLRWTFEGARLTSKVLEFEPCTRLAWDVHGLGVEGYHGWILTPDADGGTHVTSAETRCGWRARLGRMFAPSGLATEQSRWLAALNAQCLTGMPA